MPYFPKPIRISLRSRQTEINYSQAIISRYFTSKETDDVNVQIYQTICFSISFNQSKRIDFV